MGKNIVKRSNKVLLSSLLIFLFLFNLSCSIHSKRPDRQVDNMHWIGFMWVGDSIGTRYYDKLAMTVPFRLENIPYTFQSQFDLGAPSTMVYGNTLKILLDKYPSLKSKLDTVNKHFVIQGRKVGSLKDVSFYLDTVVFQHQELAYFEGYGETIKEKDLINSKNIHLGTVGTNLFNDKVLIIDFSKQRLAVMDTIPANMKGNLTDINIKNRRIIIPILINNKKYNVLYDSGTSMASLFLSTFNWDEFRDTTSTIDTLKAQAWGRKYNLYQSKTNINIQIGDILLKPDSIMANEWPDYYDFFKKMKIIGLMGNKMFYDKIILIDFKDQKFGIIKQ